MYPYIQYGDSLVTQSDWHNADIIASVRKCTGLSLRKLSIESGLNQQSCQQALQRPYLKAEIAISKAVQVPASEIWPSRYNSDGSRKHLLHGKRVTNKSTKSTFKPKKVDK